MVAASATLVSIVSAGAAVVTLAGYLYSLLATSRSAARDEALALAETRAQTIVVLRGRVAALERLVARVRVDLEEAPPKVDRALARIDVALFDEELVR
jgi:hypothetical protein